MNNAYISVVDSSLIVDFGEGDDERIAVLELKTDEEAELVDKLLGDVNLWHSFLASLSEAVTKTLGANIDN